MVGGRSDIHAEVPLRQAPEHRPVLFRYHGSVPMQEAVWRDSARHESVDGIDRQQSHSTDAL